MRKIAKKKVNEKWAENVKKKLAKKWGKNA